MKRSHYSRSPSPVTPKRRKSTMPLSDNHPKLQSIRGKVERRKQCQKLITELLTFWLPESQQCKLYAVAIALHARYLIEVKQMSSQWDNIGSM